MLHERVTDLRANGGEPFARSVVIKEREGRESERMPPAAKGR